VEGLHHVLCDLAAHQIDEVARLDRDRAGEVELRPFDRRGHDVMRRREVGAPELLAQVRRVGRQELREAMRSTACRRACGSPSRSHGWRGSPPAAIHAFAAG
jgi:hypothetical protein